MSSPTHGSQLTIKLKPTNQQLFITIIAKSFGFLFSSFCLSQFFMVPRSKALSFIFSFANPLSSAQSYPQKGGGYHGVRDINPSPFILKEA